jgi:hypothetical protein
MCSPVDFTESSEECTASIFRVEVLGERSNQQKVDMLAAWKFRLLCLLIKPENEDSMFHRIVCKFLQNYTSHPRAQYTFLEIFCLKQLLSIVHLTEAIK